MKKYDIAIVGAGIAGITAAIYLKRSNANFILLEGKFPGGKLTELKTIENYPGLGVVTGSDILLGLLNQCRQLGIEIVPGNVQTILKEEDGFDVISDKNHYEVKSVIVATGQYEKGSLIKGEQEYAGMGVSYCAVCDGNFFKGLDVAVIGNNDIALEEGLYLSNLVNKLYFVCLDNELIGSSTLLNKVKEKSNIEIILNSKVLEIKGDMMGVNKLVLENREIEVSGVFPYVGSKSSTQILNNLKPEMHGIYVHTNEDMETTIKGLYAIGDLRDKKLRQLVTAASDGAIAALSANLFVKQK